MLTDTDILRFARHLSLDEIGFDGQMKLKQARVLVVGAGGIGSACLYYLAASGIGTIGIVDDDQVHISNLNRQILHEPAWFNEPKVKSAAHALRRFYPDIKIEPHQERLDASNVDRLIAAYDLICDGSDNFETRLLLHQAAWRAKKTLVMASAISFLAQLLTFAGDETPCYECVFRKPQTQEGQTCADAGILGAVTGTVGALQAGEVVKEILGRGSLRGKILCLDILQMQINKIETSFDPSCAFCQNAQHRKSA